jgi:RimJ/RimL family protein N-acetyltransferase
MSPSPFEGELVRLRAREPEDEPAVFLWMADPDVVLFNIVRYPRSRAAVRERIAAGAEITYNHARFAIETKDEARLIGDVAIHVEEPESRCGWIAMTIGDPELAMSIMCR